MTNLNNLKPVEDKVVDLEQYEGNKIEIEEVKQLEMPSNYSERGKGWVLKVVSKEVTTIERDDGNKISVTATELFGLKEGEDTLPMGWSTQGNLQKFLDKLKVKTPSELVGKTAVIRVRNVKKDGKNKQYLGFVY